MALGEKLFYDPVMSLDSSVSCASCHRAEIAFSDDLAYSLGVEQRPGTRNAQCLPILPIILISLVTAAFRRWKRKF
ncbi:MAG: cytochrome-c peroxidase [Saprospiraceae bacterium]|nr:cytochrome-c peroxidase [Saprospiraceae bacterium]